MHSLLGFEFYGFSVFRVSGFETHCGFCDHAMPLGTVVMYRRRLVAQELLVKDPKSPEKSRCLDPQVSATSIKHRARPFKKQEPAFANFAA